MDLRKIALLFAITPPIDEQRTAPFFPSLVPKPAAGNIGDHFAFGDITSLGEGLTRLVMPVISIAIVLVIIYFLIGAFKYLTSGGEEEAIAQGQAMITHAIIGFILILFIFLILQFLPEAFGFRLPILL